MPITCNATSPNRSEFGDCHPGEQTALNFLQRVPAGQAHAAAVADTLNFTSLRPTTTGTMKI